MKTLEIARYSFKSLSHRQMRSWLTILGIVIGIASVVALLTIGQGFGAEVNRQLGALGSRTIFITPAASSSSSFGMSTAPTSGKLYQKDYERLKRIGDIEDVTRLLTGRLVMKFRDKEIGTSVIGVEPGVFEKAMTINMENGRFLVQTDRHVVVIGNTIAETAFGQNKKVGVNSYLEIGGRKFRVIGVMNKSGSSLGGGQVDSGVFVPFEDARELFSGTYKENQMTAMAALMTEGADADEVTEKIYAELDASRKVKPDDRDYAVVNPKTMQATIGEVLGMVTLFLAAVAGISLIVGGLAIVSAMFTSVIERTKEIGVLKSVGATDMDIMKIFIFEAGAIGAIGGAVGTALGIGIVYLGGMFGLPVAIDAGIALFGFTFAIVVGLVSGYVPAKRAAALKPVEALRYD